MPTRRYDDPCGIARALDAVGDRWALLVVRELIFGPKRFSQLRDGLHGVSPNVLSQRLRDLEDGGIVRRDALDPPAGVAVYELTAARPGARADPARAGPLGQPGAAAGGRRAERERGAARAQDRFRPGRGRSTTTRSRCGSTATGSA